MKNDLIDRLAGVAAAALLGVTIAAAPLAASAQQTPSAPMASPAPAASAPSATHRAKRSHTDRVETQITHLHSQLKITPNEETQWNAVAQAMRDNAHQMDELGQARVKDRAGMSAIDNLKSYAAMVDAHADGLKHLVPAMQALYDAMPDPQKKTADAVFSQRPQHRAHRAG